MTTDNPQRSYRAPCPGCGAPVDFLSAQSTHAVCAYCQSTVVRRGDTLARLGKMAELFDDHSPLQLQTSGQWDGQGFTLVGRLQYQYPEGTWTEWHALRADGSSAYLSEDNGAYVFTTAQSVQREWPAAEHFRVGASTAIDGKRYSISSNQTVSLRAAQGELPRLPALGEPFAMVELRSQDDAQGTAGSVLSVDYSSTPPAISRGVAVRLEDLKLSGLRDASVKNEQGRQFNCPQCGAALTVRLSQSKSLTCSTCNSIIDISQGMGAELQHALQDEPVQPLIALGSMGTLQGAMWQVVGYQHRMGTDPAEPDEHYGWEEYLLYNARRGFSFLVDSTDGWSLVQPATGAPVVDSTRRYATYLGTRYTLKERYDAETNYALGEFYWQVQRGQKTSNADYVSGKSLLSLEQTPTELTWSVGSRIDSDLVAKAFKLDDKKELLRRTDASPLSADRVGGVPTIVWFILLIVLMAVLQSRCSSCNPEVENCASSRTSGGSFGGFSTGGGHK